MARVLTTQYPAGRRMTFDDQGSNSEVDFLVADETAGGVPASSTSHIVYASPLWGNDTTGLGTQLFPYATIAKCYSTITTASATERWEVVLFDGEFTEAVALKPFIDLHGQDPTRDAANSYPVVLSGAITLDASFSAAGARAYVSWVSFGGTVTLDFDGATSADGLVSFTGCQLDLGMTATGDIACQYELHECTLFDAVTQTGCEGKWFNTTGNETAVSLHVVANTASGASLSLYNSQWLGDVHADQASNVTPGQVVNIRLFNSEARAGAMAITAIGANVPTIDCAYGAVPENVELLGAVSVALSPQMRVSYGLEIPTSTAILANSALDVTVPLLATLLGATSIETMSCTMTPVGSEWGTELAANDCTWSWYVRQNAGQPEIHCVIYNPTDSTVTTANPLAFIFYAFKPNVIGAP